MDNQPNPQNTAPQVPTEPTPQVTGQQPAPVVGSQPTYPTPAQQPAPMPEQPKKRKHPVLRIVVGVVIVLALIIGFFVLTFIHANSEVKDAKVVSDQFVQDMVNGDAQPAYSLTSSAFQQTTPESTLQGIATAVHKNVTGTPTDQNDWNINSTTGQPETATIDYNATGNGGSGLIKMVLQKLAVSGKLFTSISQPLLFKATPFSSKIYFELGVLRVFFLIATKRYKQHLRQD
jgi:hypothetical protein